MCFFKYFVLIPVVEAEVIELAIAQGQNKQVHLLSCDTHLVKWVVLFIGITATLQVSVPHLEGVILAGGHKLSVAYFGEAGNSALVALLALELLLYYDHVL